MLSAMLSRFTPEQRLRLRTASVGIAGAGGLGSNAAMMLARSGIGRLVLIDGDTVEASNLNRQHYMPRHLGRPKVEALAEQLRELRPDLEVVTHRLWLDKDNIEALLDEAELWLEALDVAPTKALFVQMALRAGKPVIAASGMGGIGGRAMGRRIMSGSREMRSGCNGHDEHGGQVGSEGLAETQGHDTHGELAGHGGHEELREVDGPNGYGGHAGRDAHSERSASHDTCQQAPHPPHTQHAPLDGLKHDTLNHTSPLASSTHHSHDGPTKRIERGGSGVGNERSTRRVMAVVGDFHSDVAELAPLAPRVIQCAAMQADAALEYLLTGKLQPLL